MRRSAEKEKSRVKFMCYLLPCDTTSLRVGRVPGAPTPNQPVALFLPGVTTSLLDNCIRVIPLTALYDLVVCELPGHGTTHAGDNATLKSFAPYSGEVADVSLDAFAREYAALIDLYVPHPQRLCVIGESIGGLIGAALARLRPDRIAHLVLLDTPFCLTRAPLAALLSMLWQDDPLPYLRRIYREILGFDPQDGSRNDAQAFYSVLGRLEARCTVLAGRTDYALDPPVEKRPPSQLSDDDLAALQAYRQVTILPRIENAGHCLLSDNPDACVAALSGHMAG